MVEPLSGEHEETQVTQAGPSRMPVMRSAEQTLNANEVAETDLVNVMKELDAVLETDTDSASTKAQRRQEVTKLKRSDVKGKSKQITTRETEERKARKSEAKEEAKTYIWDFVVNGFKKVYSSLFKSNRVAPS